MSTFFECFRVFLHTSHVFMQKVPIFAQNLTIILYELQLVERKKRDYLRRVERPVHCLESGGARGGRRSDNNIIKYSDGYPYGGSRRFGSETELPGDSRRRY